MRQAAQWFLLVAWCAVVQASPVIETDTPPGGDLSATNIALEIFRPADTDMPPAPEYDALAGSVTGRTHVFDIKRPPVFHHTPSAFATAAVPVAEPPRLDPTIVTGETNKDFKDLIADELQRPEPEEDRKNEEETTPIAGIFNVILGVGILVILLLRIRS